MTHNIYIFFYWEGYIMHVNFHITDETPYAQLF